jgi:hypothetical protein
MWSDKAVELQEEGEGVTGAAECMNDRRYKAERRKERLWTNIPTFQHSNMKQSIRYLFSSLPSPPSLEHSNQTTTSMGYRTP